VVASLIRNFVSAPDIRAQRGRYCRLILPASQVL